MSPLVLMSAALAVPIELEATMGPCGELTATARADRPRHPVVLEVGEQVFKGRGTVSWQGNPWAEGHRESRVSVTAGSTRGMDEWTAPRHFIAAPPAHLSVTPLAHPTRGQPLPVRAVVDTPCPAEGFVVTVSPAPSRLVGEGLPQRAPGTDATLTLAPSAAPTQVLQMSLQWHTLELSVQTSSPLTFDEPCPNCDEDGDGVTRAHGDCDDRNPTRYPGNTLAGNCTDLDCDGLIDGSHQSPSPHSTPETALWLGRLDDGLAIPVLLTDDAPVWLAFLVDQPPSSARELFASAEAPGLHTLGITVFEGPQWTSAATPPLDPGALHLRFGAVKPGFAHAYLAESVEVRPGSLQPPEDGERRPHRDAESPMQAASVATWSAVPLHADTLADLSPDEARAGQSPWQPRAWYVRVHAKWPERVCPVHVELFR